MEFTRKSYLELYRDGQPVIAQGRASNRHTSIVEAGEHAEQHAVETGSGGIYEVRVGTEVYYTVKINQVILDPTVEPESPPVSGQADLALSASAYSGDENTNIQFTIVRTEDFTERLSVDWAITNANVTPNAGTVTFEINDTEKSISVAAGEVGPTEIGELTIANPVNLSGGQTPAIITPSVASFTVNDRTVSLSNIFDLTINVGQTHDMGQYIYDPASRINSTWIANITAVASYDPSSRILYGVSSGFIANAQLEVNYV